MATALPKPRDLQRMTALAHLDAEELLLEITNGRASIRASSESPEVASAELSTVLASLAEIAQRIVETLDSPIGVPVEQAAERLDVTPPTIRKWLKDGLLKRTEGRKPVEIEPRSLIELQHALATVRDGYPARQWSKALAAYLHDRDLQGQSWATKGRDEFERGEFIEH